MLPIYSEKFPVQRFISTEAVSPFLQWWTRNAEWISLEGSHLFSSMDSIRSTSSVPQPCGFLLHCKHTVHLIYRVETRSNPNPTNRNIHVIQIRKILQPGRNITGQLYNKKFGRSMHAIRAIDACDSCDRCMRFVRSMHAIYACDRCMRFMRSMYAIHAIDVCDLCWSMYAIYAIDVCDSCDRCMRFMQIDVCDLCWSM